APHGSGTPLARRAEQEEDDLPLDSRAASFVEFLCLRSHVRSVSAYVADVDRSSHRLANDLENVEHRVGWLESPQAMQQRVADLERQVAQLQGQLDLLVRMQPYGSHPVALPPPMALPPAALQPPMALQLPAAPQYPAYPNAGAWASASCCLAASCCFAASRCFAALIWPGASASELTRAGPRYGLSKPT
ncbi:hypothetical protein L917_17637, partial [Phytophthora nicotianae]